MTFAPITVAHGATVWAVQCAKGRVMPAGRIELDETQLDAVAWDFLNSEFAAKAYSIWPIDRRVEAYLRHRGLNSLINDGGACDALIRRVMANIGRAVQHGLLAPPKD
jgi:hypothetical protein